MEHPVVAVTIILLIVPSYSRRRVEQPRAVWRLKYIWITQDVRSSDYPQLKLRSSHASEVQSFSGSPPPFAASTASLSNTVAATALCSFLLKGYSKDINRFLTKLYPAEIMMLVP